MKENKFANSNYEGLKNKAFTLIELLAIIVILAIIAVITVPVILNVIENSKKQSAIDSSYGYKDAIYKGFMTDITLDSEKELPDGVFILSNGNLVNSGGKVLNANISGTTPSEGWVQLSRGQVVAYSLKFDDYTVTKYSDTEATAEKNGEIAENAEAREARLETERQANAIVTAKTLATSQTGTTEIVEITEGWIAFINGEVKAYSLKVTEGDYTYVVTDLDVDSNNSHAVADRTISDVASTTQAEQLVVAAKVDSYVKAALSANSSLQGEDAKLVSDMSGVTTNQPNSGWIHFDKVNDSVVVVDYSLTYGTLTANFDSLTNGNYVSTFGAARNKPVIIAVGSDVCLTETDCFKVIEINGTTATLLANNNIDTSTGFQGSYGTPYRVPFSKTNYWSGYLDMSDIYDSENYSGNPGTNTYSVAYYVNMYVENLQGIGINVISGRILKDLDLDNGGIANSYKINGVTYWIGSTYASSEMKYVKTNGAKDSGNYASEYVAGVRPVIKIPTSDIQ